MHQLPLLGSDKQVDFVNFMTGPQQFLHQHLPHESCSTSDKNSDTPEQLLDVTPSFFIAVHVHNYQEPEE